jgi:hypothetical protein
LSVLKYERPVKDFFEKKNGQIHLSFIKPAHTFTSFSNSHLTLTLTAKYTIYNIWNTQICPILVKQQIVAYFSYVDEIVIIYDEKITNIEHTLKEIN